MHGGIGTYDRAVASSYRYMKRERTVPAGGGRKIPKSSANQWKYIHGTGYVFDGMSYMRTGWYRMDVPGII